MFQQTLGVFYTLAKVIHIVYNESCIKFYKFENWTEKELIEVLSSVFYVTNT